MAWVYSLHAPSRWNPWTWLLSQMLQLTVKIIARKIVLEDAAVYGDIQRGLNASVHPGVIGTREERVYVFQEYVNRACAAPATNGSRNNNCHSCLLRNGGSAATEH